MYPNIKRLYLKALFTENYLFFLSMYSSFEKLNKLMNHRRLLLPSDSWPLGYQVRGDHRGRRQRIVSLPTKLNHLIGGVSSGAPPRNIHYSPGRWTWDKAEEINRVCLFCCCSLSKINPTFHTWLGSGSATDAEGAFYRFMRVSWQLNFP